MTVKRVDMEGAQELMDDGYIFVDVRTIEEFVAGHPEGAYNVPFMERDRIGRMVPNEDFLAVMKANFGSDDKLLLSCKSGNRSAHAAALLESNGYELLADLAPGWSGRAGMPGWLESGLPTATEPQAGRGYDDLAAKADED